MSMEVDWGKLREAMIARAVVLSEECGEDQHSDDVSTRAAMVAALVAIAREIREGETAKQQATTLDGLLQVGRTIIRED